jgi:2-keto-4-pentenoate hydratase/2-oxohepta-3-ene-1,7-dioic acid hydratase in catechol pathway
MSIPKFLKPFPSKIVAVGLNYHNHAKELGMRPPKEPVIFIKPETAIISNGEKIIYPKQSKRVDYEAELALVIGKKCKDVSKKEALSYVKGYTCLNDVTARDIQFKDSQWTRAKSFDTFCPIGPKLVWADKIDPKDTKVQLYLNGKLKQDSSTKEFIFAVDEVISFISKVMTLNKGDIITTGTPPGIGPMKRGDKVEVRIEGIGSLVNFVV